MERVEQIKQKLRTHPQEIVSTEVAVKAMILNILGLVSAFCTCLPVFIKLPYVSFYLYYYL